MKNITFFGYTLGDVDYFGQHHPNFCAADFDLAVRFCHDMISNGVHLDLDSCSEGEIMTNMTGHYYIHDTTNMLDIVVYLYNVFYVNNTEVVYMTPLWNWNKNVCKKYFKGDLGAYNSFKQKQSPWANGSYILWLHKKIYLSEESSPFGIPSYNKELVSYYKQAKTNYPDSNYTISDVFLGRINIKFAYGQIKYAYFC